MNEMFACAKKINEETSTLEKTDHQIVRHIRILDSILMEMKSRLLIYANEYKICSENLERVIIKSDDYKNVKNCWDGAIKKYQSATQQCLEVEHWIKLMYNKSSLL